MSPKTKLFLFRFLPSRFETIKVSGRAYFRKKGSSEAWSKIPAKNLPKRYIFDFKATDEVVNTGQIALPSVDNMVTASTIQVMLLSQLEARSGRTTKDLWWEFRPIRQPSTWSVRWVSLKHKEITTPSLSRKLKRKNAKK